MASDTLSSNRSAFLPQPSSCVSFWQRTTRAFKHLHSNASAPVPERSKIVIIGSGFAGSLTAFSLTHDLNVPGSDIVILEAREAVSGATGRNAGQVYPDSFAGYRHYAEAYGQDEALKIIKCEQKVPGIIQDIVTSHNLHCDFHNTTTLDVCISAEIAESHAKSFWDFKAGGGETSHITLFEGEEAKKRTGVPEAITAYEWPAGSIHPAKLTQGLLERVIAKGVRLWTHCPATQVAHKENGTWAILTARGTVIAEKVVHCTNGYASAVLPRLEGFVRPYQMQAQSIVPTRAHTAENILTNTMCLRYGKRHFYTLLQRQTDGIFILGLSRLNSDINDGNNRYVHSPDDAIVDSGVTKGAMRAFHRLLPEQGMGEKRLGEGLDHAWTGILGVTPDSVPLVGEIEGLPNQYICAGFNGHGMVWIPICSLGLARLVVGEKWEDTGLPTAVQYREERLKRSF